MFDEGVVVVSTVTLADTSCVSALSTTNTSGADWRSFSLQIKEGKQ
jgi:hypothetical protein